MPSTIRADILAKLKDAGQPVERRVQPNGEYDGWAGKDVLTHLASYTRLIAAMLRAVAENRQATDIELYGRELTDEESTLRGLDEVNEAVRHEYAALTYDQAIAFWRATHADAVAQTARLTEAQLLAPGPIHLPMWTRPQLADVVEPLIQHYQGHVGEKTADSNSGPGVLPDPSSRYPLTGIRAASTDPQRALLDRAAAVLRDDPRVLASWLVGSFATGEADPFNDVDVHSCVDDAASEALRGEGWKDVLHRITQTVMATTFPPGLSIGGYALTPDWVHLDLAFYPRSSFDASRLVGMRPLFDKTGSLLSDGPIPRPPTQGEPYFPADAVDLFFYLFGNLITVLGRGEVVVATNGIVSIRDHCLVPLLLGERGIRRSGGQKRLNPFLSPEQRQLLESLPPIIPTVDAIVGCELALARIFIRRGRAPAATTGAAWPAELEAATVAHVGRGLGIAIDDAVLSAEYQVPASPSGEGRVETQHSALSTQYRARCLRRLARALRRDPRPRLALGWRRLRHLPDLGLPRPGGGAGWHLRSLALGRPGAPFHPSADPRRRLARQLRLRRVRVRGAGICLSRRAPHPHLDRRTARRHRRARGLPHLLNLRRHAEGLLSRRPLPRRLRLPAAPVARPTARSLPLSRELPVRTQFLNHLVMITVAAGFVGFVVVTLSIVGTALFLLAATDRASGACTSGISTTICRPTSSSPSPWPRASKRTGRAGWRTGRYARSRQPASPCCFRSCCTWSRHRLRARSRGTCRTFGHSPAATT